MTEQTWDDVDLSTPPPGHEPALADEWADAELVEPAGVVGFDRSDDEVSLGVHPGAADAFAELVVAAPVANLPVVLTSDVALAVRDWTNPDEVVPFASQLRTGIIDHVHDRHLELVKQRPEGKPLTVPLAAPELAFLAQTANTLDAIGDAVKAGAKEARDLAGEVVVDAKGGGDVVRTGTVSAKIADQHGGIKVTRTQATEASVRHDEVVDVLVAHLVGQSSKQEDAGAREPVWSSYYAQGIRDGIEALLKLTSAPKYKTTALEALEQQLEGAGENALAIRLHSANGRKATGNPRTTVERTEVKP